MRKYLTLAVFAILFLCTNRTYATLYHPQANFGNYGIHHFSTLAKYQQKYVGKNVMYIPLIANGSVDDKEYFLNKGGKFNTKYVISKITGNDKKMTFVLVEHGTKKKVKMIINNQYEILKSGDYFYCITKYFSVPLLLVDEFEAAKSKLLGRVFPNNPNSAFHFEVTNLILKEQYQPVEERTSSGEFNFSSIPTEAPSYPRVTLELTNKGNGSIRYYPLVYFKDLNDLGIVFTNPSFKYTYTVEDILFKKEFNNEYKKYYKVKNSISGAIKEVKAENAEYQAFENVDEDYFVTTNSVKQGSNQIELFEEKSGHKQQGKVSTDNQYHYDSLSNIHNRTELNLHNNLYSLDYATSLLNGFDDYNHLINQTLMYCGKSSDNNGNFKTGSYYRIIRGQNSLLLEDTETGKQYKADFRHNSMWVVVGYYKKIKSLYLDKEFVYTGFINTYNKYDDILNPGKKLNEMFNIETDSTSTNIEIGSVWKCTGVQVKLNNNQPLGDRCPIVLIFDNSKYGKYYCYFEDELGWSSYSKNKEDALVCKRFRLKMNVDKRIADMPEKEDKRKSNIKVMNPAEKQEKSKFDITRNWQGPRFEAYIGQTMQLIPLESYGGFYIYPNEKPASGVTLRNMQNKTLMVLDAFEYKEDHKHKAYLKIASDSDTVFYCFDPYLLSYEFFPFIFTAYYDNLKTKYLGKKHYLRRSNSLTDYVTGNSIKLYSGTIWTCSDIVIDTSIIYELKLLFTNKKGETIGLGVNEYDHWFISCANKNKLETKYGKELVLTAISGKIQKGMPKELVKIAWGTPKRINSASYGEQWVYENNYIYFKNGVVTGWN